MTSPGFTTFHLISSLRRGGRERQLATIYKYSQDSGSPCRIICFNRSADSYAGEFGMEGGISYLESKNPVSRYFEIRKILRSEKARLIWTWGGFEATIGTVLSLFTGIRHINGSIRHGIVRFNRKQLWRMLILHMSEYRVANSKAGLTANRLRSGFVMYNGIDDRFFEASSVTRNQVLAGLNISGDQLVFISVANLVPYKDYTTVIRALGRLKAQRNGFHYLVVGEGPERGNIETLIRELGLEERITILGRRTDIRDLLCASDLFIHSSRGEGCSNAILEAMSAGLPVVATDTGGTPEIINEGFGYLFPFRDEEKLYAILIKMTDKDSGLEKMGRTAKAFAMDNFSVQKMIMEYHKIITEVMNLSGTAHPDR